MVRQAKTPKPDHVLHRMFKDEIISISACDGSRCIGKQEKTFATGIDDDFRRWNLNHPGKSTEATDVSVFVMIKDATFAKMFGSLGSDLHTLSLTQNQIVEFCEKHDGKLRQDGHVTFFLFKESDHFFVARVIVRVVGLLVCVGRFGSDFIWFAGRVVVPHMSVGRQA